MTITASEIAAHQAHRPARPATSPAAAAAPTKGDRPFPQHLAEKPVHTAPARAARLALESRPDLAGRPFGAIVSLIARGLDLPAAEAPAPANSAADAAQDLPVTAGDVASA